MSGTRNTPTTTNETQMISENQPESASIENLVPQLVDLNLQAAPQVSARTWYEASLRNKWAKVAHIVPTTVNQTRVIFKNQPEAVSIANLVPDIQAAPQVSAKTWFNPELRNRWAGVAHFRHKKTGELDWSNDKLKTLKTLDLNYWSTCGSDEIQRRIALSALSAFNGVVTIQSVGAILVCAWGLVSCEDSRNYVFASSWPNVRSETLTDVWSLPHDSLVEAAVHKAITTDSALKQLNVYRTVTYFCAAALRMVTKEAKSFYDAIPTLKEQYLRFYKTELGVDFTADMACLEVIRKIMQNQTIIRNSVAPFLLAYIDLEGKNRRLCSMLYETHLSYTGIHAYRLFETLAASLEVPCDVLLGVLTHHENDDALEVIYEILLRYEDPAKNAAGRKKTCTWIYARIFYKDMFSAIQTKQCRFLTSILAMMSDKLGNMGGNRVTSIREIQGYIKNNEDISEYASRVIQVCQSEVWKD